MRDAWTSFTAESAILLKTFCGHIQRALELAFQTGHQQIVVVAKFPADTTGFNHVERLVTSFRANRIPQSFFQRRNGVSHYRCSIQQPVRYLRHLDQVLQHGFRLIVQPILIIDDVEKLLIHVLKRADEILSTVSHLQQRITECRPAQCAGTLREQAFNG